MSLPHYINTHSSTFYSAIIGVCDCCYNRTFKNGKCDYCGNENRSYEHITNTKRFDELEQMHNQYIRQQKLERILKNG